MQSPLEIVAVPALSDNYIWLVHDPQSGETAVVDPGEAAPALAEAEGAAAGPSGRCGTPTSIGTTPTAICPSSRRTGAIVLGPAEAPDHDITLGEGDELRLGDARRPGNRDPRPHAGPYRAWCSRAPAWPSSATPCSPWAAAACSRARPSRCTPRCSGLPRFPTTRAFTPGTNILCRTLVSRPTPTPPTRRRRPLARSRGDARRAASHASDDGGARESDQPVRPGGMPADFAQLRRDKDNFG